MNVFFQRRTSAVGALVAMAGVLCLPSVALAGTILQSAQNFAILAGQTVTNTGASTLGGSLGVYPGSSITNSGTFTFSSGVIHPTPDAVVGVAQQDNTNAFVTLAALPADFSPGSATLGGGQTLSAPGVYKYSSAVQLNGALTLQFTGSNQNYVFQIPTSLTTASASSVIVTGGNATDGIFWVVGSSATLGTTTSFEGNILARTSISFDTGANIVCGRALAQTGGVTMQGDNINGTCGTADFGSGGFSPTSNLAITTPEPGTFLLFGMSLIGVAVKFSARKK